MRLALVAWIGLAIWSINAKASDGITEYTAPAAKSGYEFQTPGLQAMQDDDFANPGYLWVDKGRELWLASAGESGKSCASCHGIEGEVSINGVALNDAATRYPRYEQSIGGLINLEQKINVSREQHQQAPAFEWESDSLLAMTVFVANLANGKAIDVAIGGEARPYFQAGLQYYQTRRGQLNLACSHCHDQNVGRRLRGDTITQGQANGFPTYRLQWQTIGSLHRRLRNCNDGVRAQQLPYGSEAYLSLELFLAWRARGLAIEAPAVRP